MTETLIAVEVNCETGEVTERSLTAEEIAQREAIIAESAAQQAAEAAEAQAVAEAKVSAQAKLSAIGLTAEEIAALYK